MSKGFSYNGEWRVVVSGGFNHNGGGGVWRV